MHSGYMSPECVTDDRVYSIKSNVFNFGVMVLEIAHGERSRKLHHPHHDLNLLGHFFWAQAWHLHIEGRALELIDATTVERSRRLHHPHHDLNLLGDFFWAQAWHLHIEGRALELIDATTVERCDQHEVFRLGHIGLLCVQKKPHDRPSMAAVDVMIGGDGELPEPKLSGFFTERSVTEGSTTCSSSSGNRGTCSNSMSVNVLHPI
ncbi:G-type lectin S-receptor-like serine/threonine-protein kinase SD1-1 [Linum grandiflorum]